MLGEIAASYRENGGDIDCQGGRESVGGQIGVDCGGLVNNRAGGAEIAAERDRVEPVETEFRPVIVAIAVVDAPVAPTVTASATAGA